jgi:hypothetical protein
MSTIINNLSADQVDAIISAYGSITDWFATLDSSVIVDIMF